MPPSSAIVRSEKALPSFRMRGETLASTPDPRAIPVAVLTNPSGAARGFFGVDDVLNVHRCISMKVAELGAHIDLRSFPSLAAAASFIVERIPA